MHCGFGIDLGGTTVKLACFQADGTLRDKWEIPTVTDNGGSQILPDIAASIAEYLRTHGIPDSDVLGLGIGVPGPVDQNGVVHQCVNLGWGTFSIEQALSDFTGFPVKAGNDASLAALGESWKGGGQSCANMVFVTLGTGVGGGIVVDGQVLRGVHGAGGEIGHMVLNRQETEICSCGKRGCVEQYCSATGIVRLAKKALQDTPITSRLRETDPLTCKDIFDAAAYGDFLAQTVLEQFYAYLGEFLANLCCVTDPEAVVIGGGVSKAGQPLLNGARQYFDQYVFHACRHTRLVSAVLGNDAGIYGAFKLLLNAFSS